MKNNFLQKIRDLTLLLCMITAALFATFTIFTLLTLVVDSQAIGLAGSNVGFSNFNYRAYRALGSSHIWYYISEVLGWIAIAVALFFAGFGVWQLVRGKSLRCVAPAIWLLGALYVLLAAAYGIFEVVIVNYRPILVDGVLEASYPSSHTMLVCVVMGSAIVAIRQIFQSKPLCIVAESLGGVIIALTIVSRLLSGMHWVTDIIGGVLLSGALVCAYLTAVMAARDLRETEPQESKSEAQESESEDAE